MNEEMLNRLTPLAPSEESKHAAPLILHPRIHQITAWATGTHPHVEVGQIWENLDASEGDEFGRLQVMVKSVVETDVTLQVVAMSGKAARSRIGEEVVVNILDMRPSNGQVGWVLRSVVIAVNPRGEVRSDAVLPKRASGVGVIATGDNEISSPKHKKPKKNDSAPWDDKQKSSEKKEPSKTGKELTVSSKVSKTPKPVDTIYPENMASESKGTMANWREENIQIVTSFMRDSLTDEVFNDKKVRAYANKWISKHGLIPVMRSFRERGFKPSDIESADKFIGEQFTQANV